MSEVRKYTAYCGLYCKDCIPSKKELFSTVRKLEELLKQLNFEKYAEHKSKKVEAFKEYPSFLSVLKEIDRLRCTTPCYDGPASQTGCRDNCKVRLCAVENGYQGCWECGKYKTCKALGTLKDFHPELEQNIETIRCDGIQNWSSKRGKHYKWS